MDARRSVIITCLVFPYIVSAPAVADSWFPIKKTEFYSADRSHVFVIEPHPLGALKPGHCRGTLFDLEAVGPVAAWSRHLINDRGPVQVFVSNSGRYVVTMDEWHRVGKLPLVLYGPRGSLIAVHSKDTLGLGKDLHRIPVTVSSVWWSFGSVSFFDPQEEAFFIRLHWGRKIMIDPRDGTVMDEEWYERRKRWAMSEENWAALHERYQSGLVQRVLAMLDSASPQDRMVGARACGEEGIREAAPRLKELLDDRAYVHDMIRLVQGPETERVSTVAQAAAEALRLLDGRDEGVDLEPN